VSFIWPRITPFKPELSRNRTTAVAIHIYMGKETLDTKTGIIYKSKNAAGRAVAPELGLEHIPNYTFVWYDVVRLAEPNRFIVAEIRR